MPFPLGCASCRHAAAGCGRQGPRWSRRAHHARRNRDTDELGVSMAASIRYLPGPISREAPPLAEPFSIVPRESAGNSSFARGLFAMALFFTELGTSATTAILNSRSDATSRASSGNCSRTRGLAANARFFFASVSSLFASPQQTPVRGVATRVSHGNASRARGLFATARLFNDSTESTYCAAADVTLKANVAAVIASNVVLVFMLFLRLWRFIRHP